MRCLQPEPLRPLRKNCWVIGHRGFPTVAPENTLASFGKAVEAGVDMVELDVALTSDGVPVVLHDRTLNRTTDGRGPVRKFSLAQLKRLDAGSWFSPAFAGERIPTLDEALDFLSDKAVVNIEIKPEGVSLRPGAGIEEKVVRAVVSRKLKSRVLVSSFLPRAIARVKQFAPDISTALLLTRVPSVDPRRRIERVKADALHLPLKNLTEKKVRAWTADGLPIRVYTVNESDDVKRLLDWGVDGMFTDRAESVVAILNSRSARA